MANYSLLFDGAGDRCTASDNAGYDLGTDTMTIECWVYCTDNNLSSVQTYFKKDNQYILRMDNTVPKFIVWTDTVGIKDVSSSGALTENVWTHIAGVYDGSEIRIYIDGSLDGTTLSVTGTVSASGNAVGIGSADFGGEYFPGYIDEMRISDNVRYTGASFTVPSNKFTTDANTIALWHFDEGTGTTLGDSSGNSLDMTLASSPNTPAWSTESPTLGGYETWKIFGFVS